MACCKVCGAPGWFFLLDKTGLCGNCGRMVAMEVKRRATDIESASRRVIDTLNPESKIAGLDVLAANLGALARYEDLGIPTLTESPSARLDATRSHLHNFILDTARQEVSALTGRVSRAPDPESKRRLYADFLLKLEEYRRRAGAQAELDSIERGVRSAIHQVQFGALLDAAGREEASGDGSRALLSYLEALEHLKRSEIEEETRVRHRARLNGKIKELGGRPA